jgi:hypothetical protein
VLLVSDLLLHRKRTNKKYRIQHHVYDEVKNSSAFKIIVRTSLTQIIDAAKGHATINRNKCEILA